MCIVPAYAANTAAIGSLRKIDLVEPTVLRWISVAYLNNRDLSPAGQAFLALLRGDRRFQNTERTTAGQSRKRQQAAVQRERRTREA
jgi:hypothetical protein